jgi:hypothetical protein
MRVWRLIMCLGLLALLAGGGFGLYRSFAPVQSTIPEVVNPTAEYVQRFLEILPQTWGGPQTTNKMDKKEGK